RRFRSSPYNLGVNPTDLNRIAMGSAGGFLDITTDGGATWTDINLIASVPGYQGFVTNVSWQDNQNLWITSVAQAPGAVRVVSAQLSDDVASCDSDGVLDNGETGRLMITLKNQGPNNVNDVTLTVTSSNPHVTFPQGNVLYFPPVQKNGVSTGSIQVALNGA